MNDHRAILETEKSHCEERVRGLKAYVKELTEMSAKHGTDEALLHEDLSKAKCDIEYYESQAAGLDSALGESFDSAAFHVYKDGAGEWRWNLKAANGRIIADSGEGYHDRGDCIHAIELVRSLSKAPVKEEH
ncbi:MAG TPA: DUF1508 domain-containing protein [Pyrinomonadaceae bacterium]|jgi:uncharacterized protein YegP (UPF0339 family)|nr:DUF1508 domain-containing protein [Pyrinomonadaceae bacterium]